MNKEMDEQTCLQSSFPGQACNAILATDVNGIITYWNKHATNLHQCKEAKTIGKNVLSLIATLSDRTLAEDLLKKIGALSRWEGEFNVQRGM